jgi:hypothetical protein
MAIKHDNPPKPLLLQTSTEIGHDADQRFGMQAHCALVGHVKWSDATPHDRQDKDRAIGRVFGRLDGHRASNGNVGAYRKVRAVLFERSNGENDDALFPVERLKFGPP